MQLISQTAIRSETIPEASSITNLPDIMQLPTNDEEIHKMFSCCNLGSIGVEDLYSPHNIPLFLKAVDSLLKDSTRLKSGESEILIQCKKPWETAHIIQNYIISYLTKSQTVQEYIQYRDILIYSVFEYLEKNKVCYFPCIYLNEYGGHLIVIKLTLDEHNHVEAEFSNRGDGAELQGILTSHTGLDEKVLSQVRFPKIPLARLKNTAFLSCLCSLSMRSGFNANGSIETARGTRYRADTDFFDTALQEWIREIGRPAEIPFTYRGLQRGNTCSLKPLTSFPKEIGLSRETEKRLKLQMRLLSLEKMLTSPNITPYHKFQIQWTIAKISKTCLHLGENLPPEDLKQVMELLERAQCILTQLETLEKNRTKEEFTALSRPIDRINSRINSPINRHDSPITSSNAEDNRTCIISRSLKQMAKEPLATERAISELSQSFFNQAYDLPRSCTTGDSIAITLNTLATLLRARTYSPQEIDEFLILHLSTLHELIISSWKQIRIAHPKHEKFLRSFMHVISEILSERSVPPPKECTITKDSIQFPLIKEEDLQQHPILVTCTNPSLWWNPSYENLSPRNGCIPIKELLYTETSSESKTEFFKALWRAHIFNIVEIPAIIKSESSISSILIQALIGIFLSRQYQHVSDYSWISLKIKDLARGHLVCSYELSGKPLNLTEEFNKGALCYHIYPFTPNLARLFIPILDDRLLPSNENERIWNCYLHSDTHFRNLSLQSLQMGPEAYCLLTLIGMYEDLTIPLWMYFFSYHQEILENPVIGACLEALLSNRKQNGSSVLEWALIEDVTSSTGNHLLKFLKMELEKTENHPKKEQTRKILLRILGRSYAYLLQHSKEIPNENHQILLNIKMIESLLLRYIRQPPTSELDKLTILSLYPYIHNSSIASEYMEIACLFLPLDTTCLRLIEKESISYQQDIDHAIEELSSTDLTPDHIPFFILKKITNLLIDKKHEVQLHQENQLPYYEFIDAGITTRLIITSPTTCFLEKELDQGIFYRYSEDPQQNTVNIRHLDAFHAMSDFGSKPLDFWISENNHMLVFPRQNTSECICSVKTSGITKNNDSFLHLKSLEEIAITHPVLQKLHYLEDAKNILLWTDEQGDVALIEFPRYQFQLKKIKDSTSWMFVHPDFPDAIVDFSNFCPELIPFSHYLPLNISGKKLIVMPNTIFASSAIYTFRDDTKLKGSINNEPSLLRLDLDSNNHLLWPSDPPLLIHLFFLFLYIHDYKKAEKALKQLRLHRFTWGEKETKVLHSFFQNQDEHPYSCHLRVQLLELKQESGASLSEEEQKILLQAKKEQIQLVSHGLTKTIGPLFSFLETNSRDHFPEIPSFSPYNLHFNMSYGNSIPEQPLPMRCEKNFFTLYFPALYMMATQGDVEAKQKIRNLLIRTKHQFLNKEESLMYYILLGIINMQENGQSIEFLHKESLKRLHDYLQNLYFNTSSNTGSVEPSFEIKQLLVTLHNTIPVEYRDKKRNQGFSPFSPTRPERSFYVVPEKKQLIRAHKQLQNTISISEDWSFEEEIDIAGILDEHIVDERNEPVHDPIQEKMIAICDNTVDLPTNHQTLKKQVKKSLTTNFQSQKPDPIKIKNPQQAISTLEQEIPYYYITFTRLEKQFTEKLHTYTDTELQLQLNVGLLQKMNREEILIAFARNEDQRFLDSNPQLTEADIKEIKKDIANYLLARTTWEHLIRTKKTLEAYLNSSENARKCAARSFYECVYAQRAYDKNNPHFQALLVFEALNNIRLRPEQVEALNTTTTSNRIELEARTGFGKSDVLIPLWLFLTCTDQEQLTIMVVPTSLLADQEKRLKKTLGNGFQQGIHVVTFTRKMTRDLKALKKLREDLLKDLAEKKIMLIDIRSFHGLVLTALKAALYRQATTPSSEGQEILQELWTISQLIKSSARVFIDESRECTNPRQRYDYSLEKAFPVLQEQIEHMHSFWTDIFFEESIQSRWQFDCLDCLPSSFKTPLTASTFEPFQRELASVISKKIFTDESIQQECIDHLLGGKASAGVKEHIERLDPKTKRLYAFYRYQLSLLRETLLKKYRDSYNVDEHLHAIPHERGEAKNGSVFSNIYATLNYTVQANLKREIQEEEILDFIQKTEKKTHFSQETHIRALEFWKKTQETGGFPDLLYLDETHIRLIAQHINRNPKLKAEFISIYILPTITTFPLKASGTSFNLLNLLQQVQLASGTPDPDSLPSTITSISDRTASSLNSLIAITKKSTIQTIDPDPTAALTSIFTDSDYQGGTSPPIIIDVGGNFSTLSVEEICTLFFRNNPHIKGVSYYITEKGEHGESLSKCMVRLRGSSHSIPRNLSSLNSHEMGIFIKQGNIIGTDLPMPPTAKGYITFDHLTSLNDFVQGASRLRELKNGQMATLVATTKTLDIIQRKFPTGSISTSLLFEYFLFMEASQKGNDYFFCLELLLQDLMEQKLWEVQDSLDELLDRFILMKDLLISSSILDPLTLLYQNMKEIDIASAVTALKHSILTKIREKNLPFLSAEEIEAIFDSNIDYEKLPDSQIKITSESSICETEREEEIDQDVRQIPDIDQKLEQSESQSIEINSFDPEVLLPWDGNFVSVFDQPPQDSFAEIEIYHSPNFARLAKDSDSSFHKSSYFYLLQMSEHSVKIMALDLHDTNKIFHKIPSQKDPNASYFLISDNRILVHDENEQFLIPEHLKNKLSLLNKILSGNSHLSLEETQLLSTASTEEIRSITTLLEKYQYFWPSLQEIQSMLSI